LFVSDFESYSLKSIYRRGIADDAPVFVSKALLRTYPSIIPSSSGHCVRSKTIQIGSLFFVMANSPGLFCRFAPHSDDLLPNDFGF
jgi:hypothetical protein